MGTITITAAVRPFENRITLQLASETGEWRSSQISDDPGLYFKAVVVARLHVLIGVPAIKTE